MRFTPASPVRLPLPVVALSCLLWVVGCTDRTAVTTAPRDALAEGWQQYGFGAFDASIATFDRVAAGTRPLTREHLEALYGQATVWNLRRPGADPARAGELYRQVVALAPGDDLAAWSQLALARTRALVPVGQTPDAAAVRAANQEVVDRFPQQMAGEEAFIQQQVARLQSAPPEEIRRTAADLAGFIATHPESYFLATAHLLTAECARALGEPEGRLTAEIAAFEQRQREARRRWERQPVGAFVYNDPAATFKIARIAEREAGDFAVARTFYRRFLELNPTEKRGFYAQQALANMDRAEREILASAVPSPAPPAAP